MGLEQGYSIIPSSIIQRIHHAAQNCGIKRADLRKYERLAAQHLQRYFSAVGIFVIRWGDKHHLVGIKVKELHIAADVGGAAKGTGDLVVLQHVDEHSPLRLVEIQRYIGKPLGKFRKPREKIIALRPGKDAELDNAAVGSREHLHVLARGRLFIADLAGEG